MTEKTDDDRLTEAETAYNAGLAEVHRLENRVHYLNALLLDIRKVTSGSAKPMHPRTARFQSTILERERAAAGQMFDAKFKLGQLELDYKVMRRRCRLDD